MRIEYSDGRKTDCETEAEARQILDEEYPDAVYHDEWEPSGREERLLVWRNEDDAGEPGLGDGGQNAVAEILRDA